MKLPKLGWLAWTVIVLVGLGVLGNFVGDKGASAQEFKPGDQVALYVSGAEMVFLATSEAAWDEMRSAQQAKSVQLMARLMDQGKVIMTPSGSKVVVVKVNFTSVLVVLSNGPLAGREGWIQKEFVVRYGGPVAPQAAPGSSQAGEAIAAFLLFTGSVIVLYLLFRPNSEARR